MSYRLGENLQKTHQLDKGLVKNIQRMLKTQQEGKKQTNKP